MIIANLRNPTDLDNKRRLQQQLIELEIANEAELERRVKDFKDPNKPIPVAPQQKTNAQLRKDRIENERQAIKNMEDLGFDYSRGAELVAWLSSSEVDKLIDFNANYKGIKKELVETTNPKLLTTEYLKNYLERYFEDLDVSYGRKFAQQTQRESQITLSVDELMENIPTPASLEQLKQAVLRIQEDLRKDLRALNEQISANEGELATEPVEREQQRIKREIERRRKELEDIKNTLKKGFLIASLLDLYVAVIPTPEFFGTLKLGLPIQERTDLVRRYGRIFEKIKALNTSSTDELLAEAVDAGTYQLRKMLYNKMERALAFLSNNKGVDLISSLNRNYESELAKQGKEVELTKIKQFNDIQEKRKREAEESVRNYLRNPFIEDTIAVERETPFIENVAGNFASGDYARQIETREDPEERRRMEELVIDHQNVELEIQAKARELERRQMEIRRQLAEQAVAKRLPELERRRLEEERQRLAELREQLIREMIIYYDALINEINGIPTIRARVNTIKSLFANAGIQKPDGNVSFSTNEQGEVVYNKYVDKLRNWIKSNRLQPVRNGALPEDYDYDGSRGRPLARANLMDNFGVDTGGETIRGLGLKKALKSHFKDDEEELMDMAKALRKHKKKEAMIDKYAKGEDSSSEDEKMGGSSHLGFKHSRIKVGKGISVRQKQPHYKTFGKYVIHMGHLIDKNIANFKYPSLGSIPSIRPLNITDDYKEFIIDTLENEKPNERILRKLPLEEQKHFERVVAGAGLLDTFRLKRIGEEDEKKEVDRFNILRGEILAGNNNENVVKELKGLVVKFINDGKIRRQEGLNMLMELSVI